MRSEEFKKLTVNIVRWSDVKDDGDQRDFQCQLFWLNEVMVTRFGGGVLGIGRLAEL